MSADFNLKLSRDRHVPYLSVIVPAYNEAKTITAHLDRDAGLPGRPTLRLRGHRLGRRHRRHPRGGGGVCPQRPALQRHRHARSAAAKGRASATASPAPPARSSASSTPITRPPSTSSTSCCPSSARAMTWSSARVPSATAGSSAPSRFTAGSGLRRSSGPCACWWACTGIGDTQCGFKFFQRRRRPRPVRPAADRRVHVRRRGPAPGRERAATGIKEVGVRWRDDGDTRYDPVAGTLENARELLRIRFS